MKKAILATKVGMTQIFNAEDGVLIPVTVLQAGPCVVTQVKTVENDGYSAVQVGFVDKKEKIVTKDNSGKKAIAHRNGVTKAEKGHFDKAGVSGKRYVKEFRFDNAAEKGHFDKAGVSGKRYVKEFRFDNAEEYALAQEIKADIFMLLLRRSKLTSSQKAITSMRQQSPKVKVSRARSNATDRAEDL